ncbi:hypothetical protein [Amycolatopsis sp. NPDC004079]|uniref:hypothetical protein n=1 Tax=Amycolatopsis sp. NPDC004079 TaxID=3154549 RepID=UPI0033A52D35
MRAGWSTKFRDFPDVTWAGTLDDLRVFMVELIDEHRGRIDDGFFEQQLRHADEQATAARAVGFSKVRYGLLVRPCKIARRADGTWDRSLFWQVCMQYVAPTRPVTKLAYAAVVAAPRLLSDGDASALRVMGYRDAADVARRIRQRPALGIPEPNSELG